MKEKTAVIIGAGPAGLTAAYELIEKTGIKPLIFEASGDIGGISKTVNYKGNRIDIGGHRFFSKSDRVMRWWETILPIQGAPSKDDIILGTKKPLSTTPDAPDPEAGERMMLIRSRLSRIFFLRKFFDYPIALNATTFFNLGILRNISIGLSYFKARIFPIKKERSLEDFFINRFGRVLYLTFFKDYTEKVWGVPCEKIKPEWGAQRIKGLSISKAIAHAVRSSFSRDSTIAQKKLETSLIGQFLYPKFGPGQMWEEVASIVKKKGCRLHLKHKVTGLAYSNEEVVSVEVEDIKSGKKKTVKADYFFSTMPVKDLIGGMRGAPEMPEEVREVAAGLLYRDFITVGLLLKKLKIKNESKKRTVGDIIPDNWIYIQERDVKLGRLQIFNNWSPYMVKDDSTIWIGLEYFCNEGDALWSMGDRDFQKFAIEELSSIGIIEKADVLDSTIIRMPKTYPAYFGAYDRFSVVMDFTDRLTNLFLIGRNGMHKYNNQDHSMLSAITAVENIINGRTDKSNIWEINIEEEYHEDKK